MNYSLALKTLSIFLIFSTIANGLGFSRIREYGLMTESEIEKEVFEDLSFWRRELEVSHGGGKGGKGNTKGKGKGGKGEKSKKDSKGKGGKGGKSKKDSKGKGSKGGKSKKDSKGKGDKSGKSKSKKTGIVILNGGKSKKNGKSKVSKEVKGEIKTIGKTKGALSSNKSKKDAKSNSLKASDWNVVASKSKIEKSKVSKGEKGKIKMIGKAKGALSGSKSKKDAKSHSQKESDWNVLAVNMTNGEVKASKEEKGKSKQEVKTSEHIRSSPKSEKSGKSKKSKLESKSKGTISSPINNGKSKNEKIDHSNGYYYNHKVSSSSGEIGHYSNVVPTYTIASNAAAGDNLKDEVIISKEESNVVNQPYYNVYKSYGKKSHHSKKSSSHHGKKSYGKKR